MNSSVTNSNNSNDILYTFSGHYKTPIPIFDRSNYNWEVNVYSDHLDILRRGRLEQGHQEDTRIYFDDVVNIHYGNHLGSTWIKFYMPGIEDTSPTSFTNIQVSKNLSISETNKGSGMPVGDTYSIVFYTDKENSLKKHFDIIYKIYDDYRRTSKNTLDISNSSISSNEDSPFEKLKKLKELFELGIISSEEYESKRNDYISKL